jgi:hypothetical protein
MTITIEITIATIGRLTKNFAMAYFPAGAGAAAGAAGEAAASTGFGTTSPPGRAD